MAVGGSDVDFRDPVATYKLFDEVRPTLVFHLAARVYGIMGNLTNKAQAYLENIRINTNVIDAAHLAGASKIVAMGSAAIYSDSVQLPMRETDIWTGEPHSSESAYAHAKRAMYAQLMAYYEQYGLDYAYCVSTNLYGPHDRFSESWGHVIPSLISKFHRAATTGTDVTVWGTGMASRDFLYGSDAAAALQLVAEKHTGPINIASGTTHTVAEVASILKSVSNLESDIIWDTTKPDGQQNRMYDIRALTGLGFSPEYDIERGLTETYEWFDKNVDTVRR